MKVARAHLSVSVAPDVDTQIKALAKVLDQPTSRVVNSILRKALEALPEEQKSAIRAVCAEAGQ